MINGVGTDLVEIERIKRSLSKGDAFKRLVFHPDEITYCDAQGRPEENYAGRFAVKEAFLKAIGTGWRNKTKLNEIVVRNDENGQPKLYIEGETRVTLGKVSDYKRHISISHTDQSAVAIVILES